MTDRLEPHRVQWCFSTLGCADLLFSEICQLAAEFGISGVELRGIGGRMDMPQYCKEAGLTPQGMKAIARGEREKGSRGDSPSRPFTLSPLLLFSPAPLRLVVAGSSVKLTTASDKDRAELLNFGAWAETLQIPYLRVFGGGSWGRPLSEADYAHAVETVSWWRAERKKRQWRVDLILETHDAFSGAEPCLKLNQLLGQPLDLIWDSHHTWRVGGESPELTWKSLKPFVRHVQVKDSVDRPSARHPYTYVLPGDGQMPLREVMALLQREKFDGFVSLEWERFWHPYLPPLRDALARLRERNGFVSTPS